MIIIGCDFHTRYQQIAMANDETGELLLEKRLDHQSGEAHEFYRNLHGPVRIGIESTGPIHWFERLLAELGHELWIGDAAKIRASEVRKQKTDERRVAHRILESAARRGNKGTSSGAALLAFGLSRVRVLTFFLLGILSPLAPKRFDSDQPLPTFRVVRPTAPRTRGQTERFLIFLDSPSGEMEELLVCPDIPARWPCAKC